MITRIEAYRYRCFKKLVLNIGPYQMLVGKNGAGKSTLLDIPVLIGEILEARNLDDVFFKPTVSHKRPRADSPRELIYNGQEDWFAFALELEIPEHIRDTIQRNRMAEAIKETRLALENNPDRIYFTIRYEIAIRLVNEAFEIMEENLLLLPKDRKLTGDDVDGIWGGSVKEDDYNTIRCIIQRDSSGISNYQSEIRIKGEKQSPASHLLKPATPALSGLPLDVNLFSASEWLQGYLRDDAYTYSPNMDAMRRASIYPGKNWKIYPDASSLVWSLFELKNNPEEFEEWLDHVKNVLPLLSDIEPKRREDDGLGYFRAHYGEERQVNNSGLSDGTLSILALTILPFVNNAPGLLTIEEPENGIHPKAIEAVLEALTAIPNSQVWITTHSPIAVAVTPLENLLCLKQSKDDGVVVTPGKEHPQLKHWQGTPSLSTLHSAGIL
jgi:hypothetical protein